MDMYKLQSDLKELVQDWNSRGKEHTKPAAYFTKALLNLNYGIMSAVRKDWDEKEGI